MKTEIILKDIRHSTILVQRNVLYYKLAFNFFITLFIVFFLLLLTSYLFEDENISFLNWLKAKKYHFVSSFLIVLFFGYGGRELFKRMRYNEISKFSEGLARVNVGAMIGGKYGFIDRKYNLVIPLIYDYAEHFTEEGLARVTIGEFLSGQGRTGFIDKLGNIVVPFNYGQVENFSEGLALVMSGDMYHDFIDIMMNKKNTPITNKYGFIDKTGKEVIPLQFSMAHSFKNGVAGVTTTIGNVRKVGKYENWGFIDRKGNFITPYIFEKVELNDDGYKAFLNGKEYKIDRNFDIKTITN